MKLLRLDCECVLRREATVAVGLDCKSSLAQGEVGLRRLERGVSYRTMKFDPWTC
jgi:hypothetical protein